MLRTIAAVAILCALSLVVAAFRWYIGGTRATGRGAGVDLSAQADAGAIGKSGGARNGTQAAASAQDDRASNISASGSSTTAGNSTASADGVKSAAPAQAAASKNPPETPAASPRTPASLILEGAKIQVREGAVYTPGYFRLQYPNGDLPRDKGVCTDVVVRALRHAGFDLQKLVHEDMKANFDAYPQTRIWGLTKPDPNIDHRRVPNLAAFFSRHGEILTCEVSPGTLAEWQPGDIVCWKLPDGREHCGIVSDGKNGAGIPTVIHNIAKCCEEDCLDKWKITGHFRYPAGRLAARPPVHGNAAAVAQNRP